MIKDTYLDYFLGLMKKGDIFYLNGNLYTHYRKHTNQYGTKIIKLDSPRKLGKKNNKGYIQISAYLDGKEVYVMAHRLIWTYFHGRDSITEGLQINHENGIKDDNRIENLELVTQSKNIKHAYDNGLNPKQYGERNPAAKLKKEDICTIRELIQSKVSDCEIGRRFGCSSTSIRNIRIGKTWNEQV